MRRVTRALLGMLMLGLSACSSDSGNSSAKPAAAPSACLERPERLPRPPAGRLPCDLIPPGLSLD